MVAQCPECARFLSKDFVASLLVETATCPKCGIRLEREMFHGDEALVDAPPLLADSVRPPDLDPATLAGGPGDHGSEAARDVLAGWDTGAEVIRLDEHRDRGLVVPLPAGPAVVAAALGAVVGATVSRGHRGLGAAAGAAVGVVAAAAVRTGISAR